ncbi:MAG: hypothetical protein PF439_05375 [Helicobacteraceae bacterium]|jgi:hypothetical protein|nr:hypothetical protein [Helicobacteraceae bacterium]
MKNTKSLGLAATAAAVLMMSADASAAYTLSKKIGDVDTKLDIYGFAQLEARGGDAFIGDTQDAAVKFGAQRVRLGWNYTAGKVRGKVFLDFNQDSTVNAVNGDVGMPKMVKDAFVSYVQDDALVLKVGLIKMPHGMGFTIPGWNLDIVERGFDKQLAMERNMGIMLSGRDMFFGNNGKVNGFEMGHERPWKGFGYDIMIGNQAARSGSVTNAKPGDANSYVGRLMFDWTELLHTEVSYAVSENAGGIEGHEDATGAIIAADTEDLKSLNFGIDSHFLDGANVKFEYYNSENLKGVKGWDESTMAFTAAYAINEYVEPSIKHIQGAATKGGVDTKLGNTYIGVNLFVSPFDNKMDRSSKRKRNAHRMQFDYVVATGDTDGAVVWNGLKGYKSDGWMFQYQYKF